MKLKNIWFQSWIWKKLVLYKQNEFLNDLHKQIASSVIIFLIPSEDKVNGGVLSIVSLAEETVKLKHIHSSDVFVCSLPGEPFLFRFTKFENSVRIIELNNILSRLKEGSSVLIHIPEIFVDKYSAYIESVTSDYSSFKWSFNILLQNIDLLPQKKSVDILSDIGNVTCTTAHLAYSGNSTESRLGCPVYHFSVWCSPEGYYYKPFEEKENLIIVSPDKHPRREEVINYLKENMPDYDFKVIRKLTYEEYKKLISCAKYSITFGEGLDGYFIENIFSGGIGSSVYNDRFFTDEFVDLPFVYSSWNDFMERFPKDAESSNCSEQYQKIHQQQYNILSSMYSHEKYVQNLTKYYYIYKDSLL